MNSRLFSFLYLFSKIPEEKNRASFEDLYNNYYDKCNGKWLECKNDPDVDVSSNYVDNDVQINSETKMKTEKKSIDLNS